MLEPSGSIEPMITVMIPSLSAICTAWIATAGLSHRRRMETLTNLVQLAKLSLGRPDDGRDGVGVGEQLAAIAAVEALARKYRWCRSVGEALLTDPAGWSNDPEDTSPTGRVASAARSSIASLGAVRQ
jgi:hypothetical protein